MSPTIQAKASLEELHAIAVLAHHPLVLCGFYGDCIHKVELGLLSCSFKPILYRLTLLRCSSLPPALSLVCQSSGAAVLALSLGGWLLCECWQQGLCWGNEDGCPCVGRAGCLVVSHRTMRRFLETVEARHRNTANRSPCQKNVSFRRDSLSLN